MRNENQTNITPQVRVQITLTSGGNRHDLSSRLHTVFSSQVLQNRGRIPSHTPGALLPPNASIGRAQRSVFFTRTCKLYTNTDFPVAITRSDGTVPNPKCGNLFLVKRRATNSPNLCQETHDHISTDRGSVSQQTMEESVSL